jgi:5'(3')-deoxyribonucleotidase
MFRSIRRRHRRKRVVFDLDSFIADLMSPWLAWYNETWRDNLSMADITSYAIQDHVKPECHWKVFDFFRGPEGPARYGSIPIFPGAAEGLAKLNQHDVEIIIATATAGSTAPEKYTIAKRAAPFLDKDHIQIGSKKELIHGDFFGDDAPKNIAAYLDEWPDTHVMTIGHPYNQEFRDKIHCFADDYNNTRTAWEKMVDYILTTDLNQAG